MASRPRGRLRVYRIADGRYRLFDGGGAAKEGGRWNSPGRPVIYGSLSFAGAMLERLAQASIGRLPKRDKWIAIEIPAGVAIEELRARELPGWDAADKIASRGYGDRWLAEARTVALIVPSVPGRPHERNVAINQDHPGFVRRSASEPAEVEWDERLFRPRRAR